MRFSSAAALALSSGALAMSQHECFLQNSADLAEFSDCGHHGSLTYCLSHLPSTETSDIEACYANAGCSKSEATIEAKYTLDRCEEMLRLGELRKRHRAVVERAEKTMAAPEPEAAAPTPTLAARDTNLVCLATSTVSTSSCPEQTSNGVIKTLSCFPTEVAKSACAPGLMCSMDSTGVTVCMKMQNGLDVGGIIIAIVFGVSIVIGITFLTFQSCKESRHHKQLEARAEATALARAQTKKKRAQESRAPLMRQQEGGDPFHDRNQS